MDYTESFAPIPQSTLTIRPSVSKSSGLTLVLPALKGGKPIKGKKSKGSQPLYGAPDDERKIPRPVKLKPLKEVLAKLIVQIKKKDDYAFFLKPVDPTQVQGYSDVVKRPMDLGTMSVKVARGRYRSLEDFASDLRLVTSNAKAFNPPGTIHHTEADRIEAWGLDHISKASSTVIQYETDWNIEIEKDDDGPAINIDDDDDYNVGTPMDVEAARGGRSPSVASQVQPGTSRRGVRGPYKKAAATTNKLSESLDPEGRLPGSRDGLGAFPPGSDWAKTMVALKLKGKRYKTKKERLRVEKEGPPLLEDGSLDYTEMEDPFSVLSALTSDPFSRPYLTPLHPPLFTQPHHDPSSSQPPRPSAPFPTSINLPLAHLSPKLPGPATSAGNPAAAKRRHWVVTRNPTRSKGKDRDEDVEVVDAPAWQTPREVHAIDYGSFARLAGVLEEEVRRRGIVGKEGEEEEKILQVARDTVDQQELPGKQAPGSPANDTGVRIIDYWSTERAMGAERYIRDVVYGGVDGLAYIRSLAEFVQSANTTSCPGLGSVSLAKWVEQELVDALTDGRHALLRETARELTPQASGLPYFVSEDEKHRQFMRTQVSNSLHVYPSATVALAALLQIKMHKIDMGSLIKTPGELFQSEEEWAGKVFREQRKAKGQELVKVEDTTNGVELEVEEAERTWMDVDVSAKSANSPDNEHELEGPEELNEVLDYVANIIINLDKKIKEEKDLQQPLDYTADTETKGGIAEDTPEDSTLRNLRLNLLALAKRAPLDTIARLPKDLVPEHIRHFVPTLSTTG